jgi:hypothetical protein
MSLLYKYIKSLLKKELTVQDVEKMSFGKFSVVIDNTLSERDVMDCVKNNGIIILLLKSTETSGHFVSITVNHELKLISFFDSYGFHPDFLSKRFGDDLNLYLQKLVLYTNYKLEINITRLQELNEEVNNCGRYAVLRNFNHELPNNVFLDLLDEPILLKTPDMIATMLTASYDMSVI